MNTLEKVAELLEEADNEIATLRAEKADLQEQLKTAQNSAAVVVQDQLDKEAGFSSSYTEQLGAMADEQNIEVLSASEKMDLFLS